MIMMCFVVIKLSLQYMVQQCLGNAWNSWWINWCLLMEQKETMSGNMTTSLQLNPCSHKNCSKIVIPNEYLSLDETLYQMRQQIVSCQYNPNKTSKYGLLFRSINDAHYPYAHNAYVYCSKWESGHGEFYIEGTGNYIKDLANAMKENIDLQGRNISMDHLYSSISITNWLLQKNMASHIGILDALKDVNKRENTSYNIHWKSTKRDTTLCIMRWWNEKTCSVQVLRLH